MREIALDFKELIFKLIIFLFNFKEVLNCVVSIHISFALGSGYLVSGQI